MGEIDEYIRNRIEKIADQKEKSYEEVLSEFEKEYNEIKRFYDPPEILDDTEVALRRLSSRTLSIHEKTKDLMPSKRVSYLCSIKAIC